MKLSDPASERAVLAGICKLGNDGYLDVADILQSSTFTIDSNSILFNCLEYIFAQEKIPNVIDIASVYSAAHAVGLSTFLEKKTETEHLKAIFNFPVSPKNLRMFAAKIRRLHVARVVRESLKEANDKYLDLTGDESINNILGIAEDAVFNLSSLLKEGGEDEPQCLFDGITKYVEYLGENPVDQLGISTGFPNYDTSIGGGLRPGTVNLIGARPKVGKTLLSDNMGYYIAKNGTPVLNMDTEMRREDHQHRTLAMMTECYVHDIETGKYTQKPGTRDKILETAKETEKANIPYDHMSISGMPFEEQLAVMRRWLAKRVGFDDNGKANSCVIVYDYLKLMTSAGISSDMKEYQMLGFMMTSLHNFAMRYQVPVLGFMQLNRDGISKEDTDVASGSDRIIWLCSNFAIFKKKSDEEIAEDGGEGNRKLVPVISRHGAEWEENNYINCNMKGFCAKITEGKTKFESMREDKISNEGFEVEKNGDDEEPVIPFD